MYAYWKVPPLKPGECGGAADVGKWYAQQVNEYGHLVGRAVGPLEDQEEAKAALENNSK